MGDWFESWFDSKYYHILYKNRNEEEAKHFLRNLMTHLHAAPDARILDLACGKGRHAIFLRSLGYTVMGTDLAANSIHYAQQFSDDRLSFAVQDMRKPLPDGEFDYVFNLFTSFGYFDDLNDNLSVLQAAHTMLVPGGTLVIDFLNAVRVVQNLISEEVKTCDSFQFHISRYLANGCVFKKIRFTDEQGNEQMHTERVQLLGLEQFTQLLEKTGFTLKTVFGDYNLGTFAPSLSDRLILIAVKN